MVHCIRALASAAGGCILGTHVAAHNSLQLQSQACPLLASPGIAHLVHRHPSSTFKHTYVCIMYACVHVYALLPVVSMAFVSANRIIYGMISLFFHLLDYPLPTSLLRDPIFMQNQPKKASTLTYSNTQFQ